MQISLCLIDVDGNEVTFSADASGSLMEAAVEANVAGIEAQCGGGCNCATCHVLLDDEWLAKVGGQGDIESAILDFTPNAQPNSRLSCQIELTPDLDGLSAQVVES